MEEQKPPWVESKYVGQNTPDLTHHLISHHQIFSAKLKIFVHKDMTRITDMVEAF